MIRSRHDAAAWGALLHQSRADKSLVRRPTALLRLPRLGAIIRTRLAPRGLATGFLLPGPAVGCWRRLRCDRLPRLATDELAPQEVVATAGGRAACSKLPRRAATAAHRRDCWPARCWGGWPAVVPAEHLGATGRSGAFLRTPVYSLKRCSTGPRHHPSWHFGRHHNTPSDPGAARRGLGRTGALVRPAGARDCPPPGVQDPRPARVGDFAGLALGTRRRSSRTSPTILFVRNTTTDHWHTAGVLRELKASEARPRL